MFSGRQQVIGNVNSFNALNYNNIFNINAGSDDGKNQILQWLSPLEPQQRHESVRTDRLDSVGNWVLETNEFRKWCDAEDGCVESVLFCYGNPGVGKTYISSLVIDSLCDRAEGEDIAVVGLYCDFLAQQEQSATSMLGAILKQLASRGGIPKHIQEAFQKAKGEFGGRGLRLPDMVEILKKTITSLQRIFVCIDALDESAPKHRRELLKSLQEILQISPNMRVLLTGRPHIDDEITEFLRMAVRIPVIPAQDDIRSYLKMRLDSDTTPKAMDDELQADIMRVIPEKISEIFLLVSLNIDAILGEITLYQRRRKLDEMTKGEGLGEAYAATILRIKAQQRSMSKLGMKVLMWISHSERPLHVDELCHALGVEEGSADLNIRNIPAIETLLACSLGLVTVEKSSSTLRLVHYTLREYLSHNPNLFSGPHAMIAEICLTYLNFRHTRSFPPTLRSVPPTIPFVDYASSYWGAHARRGTTKSVKILALKILDGYDKHISSKMLLHKMSIWDRPLDLEDRPTGFTGLHGVAYFGCVEIVVALLEMNKWDVQATDLKGNTAIAWAAKRGHEGVVRTLLEQNDANPDTPDKYSRTPLSFAAENGHEGVAKILLEQNNVNPEAADNEYCQTPLSFAAENGHEGVVRILLEQSNVNPNTPDKYGRTPLSFAAENGHEGVVRVLLRRNDVNTEAADNEYCQTPLLFAVENGHEGVVRILLEQSNVNPNTPDKYGRTPLSCAAENGYEGVIRILLGRNDVNPEAADNEYCQTPLSFAAENEHEGAVKILLERHDINPNTSNEYGRTPLSLAAENGHEGVVKLLLGRNDVNPDMPDKYGLTPLSWAAQNGHEGVVGILLGRYDVNPDRADTLYRQTPLSFAAENGHQGVVRILLGRNDVNPKIPDEYGLIPLSWAAQNGHEGIVKILLEQNKVNPNTPDKCGRTPLSLAAENGHERVVRILLGRNNVNPDTADTLYRQTPFSFAAENGHEEVVRMLLERDDVNPDAPDKYGLTPLSWAAQNGHEGVVRTLLARDGVNPNTLDEYGRTPLSFAAENGYERVVKILLERNDVNPDIPDKYDLTPLSWAMCNGYERIAELLQNRPGLIPRYITSVLPLELPPTRPPGLSEPPLKRIRRF